MLQDFERGRPVELDAIVGAVAALGKLVGQPTPMIDAVYALTRHKAIRAGLYGA
jgi:2-dehydropantoate 2-reductase